MSNQQLNADKMATPQQKLRMKMTSIDTWSIREQLCLASSVLRSGDQNWVSVSRSLKSFAEPDRPNDWLSPKNCALQYNSLLEKTGAHKRKRGERHPSTGSLDSQPGETPGEIILRQLTQERIEELQQMVESTRNEYKNLKKELELVQAGNLDDQLQEICKRIDEENDKKIKEQEAHLKWLKEREIKLQEFNKAQQALLRSPSKTSLSQSESMETELATSSPSVTDQLNIDVTPEEGREPPAPEVKTPSGSNLTPVPSTATPSSPLLTSLLRSPTAVTAGTPSAASTKLSFNLTSPTMSPGLKNLVSSAASVGEEVPSPTKAANTSPGGGAPTLTRLLELPLNSPGKPLPELTVGEETEVTTAVSPSKSEVRADEEEASPGLVEETVTTAPSEGVPTPSETETKEAVQPSTSEKVEEEVAQPTVEPEEAMETEKVAVKKEEEIEPEAEAAGEREAAKETPEDMNVVIESEVEVSHNEGVQNVEETVTQPASVPKSEPADEEETVKEEVEKEPEEEVEFGEEKTGEKEELIKSPEADTSMSKPEAGTPKLTRRPLRGMRRKDGRGRKDEEKSKGAGEAGPTTRRSSGRKSLATEEEGESFGEPADAAPSSSKKKAPPPPVYIPSPSPAPSSGMDSTPNSPTSSVSTVTEDDREYRTWKKSILLLWRDISSHKNASLFAKPVAEEHVPGYRSVVKRPMDLSTIKKNIENGLIRSTVEFHRDFSLMFFNSIVFNPNSHEVNRLAREMFTETNGIIQDFINNQLMAAHNMESSRPHRRETRDVARRTESLSSHEETPSKPEEGKTRASKRASVAPVAEDSAAVKTKRRSRVATAE